MEETKGGECRGSVQTFHVRHRSLLRPGPGKNVIRSSVNIVSTPSCECHRAGENA